MLFYKETNFKDTEVGRIPKDWEVVKLGNEGLAVIIMGQSPPSSTYNREGKGLPFLQGKMEFGDVYPSPIMYCSQPIKIAEPNDVLISVRAPVGDVNVAPYKLCIGRGLATIRFNLNRASHWFYFYYFQKIKNLLENLGKGSTFKAINKEDLENLKVPYPSLFEQQKIAEILSTVDDAIQKTNEIIAKTERLKKGLMHELLTKGIGHKEFKNTEIGRIPKDWEVVRLEEICEKIKAGGTPLTTKKEFWNGNIPFVKIEDITSSGKYLMQTLSSITNTGLENSNAWLVPERSLLLAMYGSLGEVSINIISVATNQAILGIIPKEKDDLEFLYYWFLYFKPYWRKFAKPTTQANLTAEIVRNTMIPLPSTQERRKIAEILSTVDHKLEAERKEKAKLERIKQGLMDLLLTGKVRVRL